MVSLNSVNILIIIWILFNPFFRCLLLSEKHCHSLFIRPLTEPDRDEVHCQTIQMIKWWTNSNSPSSMLHAKTRCRSVHVRGFNTGQKRWKIRTGLRVAGPSGCQAFGPPGRWAVAVRGPAFSKTREILDGRKQSDHWTTTQVYEGLTKLVIISLFEGNHFFNVHEAVVTAVMLLIGASVSKLSGCRTLNPEIPSSSPALTTSWICSM